MFIFIFLFIARNVEYTLELDSENEIKRGFVLNDKNEKVSTLTSTLKDVSNIDKCSQDFTIYLKVKKLF